MQGFLASHRVLSILAALNPLAVMSWPHVVFVSSAGPAPVREVLPLWIGRHWRIHCWWPKACRRKRWIWAESFGWFDDWEIFEKTCSGSTYRGNYLSLNFGRDGVGKDHG